MLMSTVPQLRWVMVSKENQKKKKENENEKKQQLMTIFKDKH